jgi:predicted nucleotidyltransferase
MMIPEEVKNAALQHPYPLLFATVSGAHLYGFPSPDSDWDLRGVHVVPAKEAIGLAKIEETIEIARDEEIELDLVTHDAFKFFKLLLRPNGYVLEQLLSPIVVLSTPEHEELKALAPSLFTRHHAHHYLGFADNQWKLFRKEDPLRVKPLLYTFRVLLTGIHLMQSGQLEANLKVLNERFQLPFVPDLLARKLNGAEQQTLNAAEVGSFEKEFVLLRERLVQAAQETDLPDAPSAFEALNDILIRIRLASVKA